MTPDLWETEDFEDDDDDDSCFDEEKYWDTTLKRWIPMWYRDIPEWD